MLEFDNIGRQGDVLLERVDALPSDVTEVAAEDGRYILAHSETGHHHVMEARPDVKMYRDKRDPLVAYVYMDTPAPLVHLRSYHTHQTIAPKIGGWFRVRSQRQATPQGWERAAD